VAQVADFAAENGLGQEVGHEGTIDANVLAHVAEIDDFAPLPNEVCHLASGAGAGHVVVGERNDAGHAQVVAQLDHAVPDRDAVMSEFAALAAQDDAFDRLAKGSW
jgi:hypothetical protein